MIGPKLRLALGIAAWLLVAISVVQLVQWFIGLTPGAAYQVEAPVRFVADRLINFAGQAVAAGILLALLSIDERLERKA